MIVGPWTNRCPRLVVSLIGVSNDTCTLEKEEGDYP
jgi:hypothetical protein